MELPKEEQTLGYPSIQRQDKGNKTEKKGTVKEAENQEKAV